MNIMRKLRGGVANANNGPSSSSSDCSDSGGPGSPHLQLGLMHLKKLFSEYTHPAHPLSDAEKDEKLYSMLPLFCKVFGSSPICDMNEKFWDILAFCHQVSLLMVAEIRKRASNQSTETASCAIAKFLEIESCEESSNGWMLLSTLNLLAAGDAAVVQKMSDISVPSTLVKCLYLFFDLPEMSEQDGNKKDANSDFTPKERRILLQKIFVQLLVRLCSHRIPAEELARKDDLHLLFSAITSWCPQHNVMWRKSAAEVLMTLSRHGLTPPVVSYIHSKKCVAICIDNMQRVPELAPLELVEMFVTVFCFLKDSSEVSSTLLDDFRQAQGYLYLSDFLLKLENDKTSEAQESVRNLVLMITSLCMCGYMELKPSQASTGSLFQMQGFSLPQPSGRGTSVRNIQAFHVLQSTFLKATTPPLCASILDAISSIYHADNANYFILEHQNTLSQFTERIHHKAPAIQQQLFQLVAFLVFQLNFVPCKELISMSILLKTHSLNQAECSVLCMEALLALLAHHPLFKDVYREVGLLEVFVTCLNRYGNLLETRRNTTEFVIGVGQEQLGNLVVDGMISLLSGNASNANVLRECGGAKSVHGLVCYPECRQKALGIVRELVLTTGGDDDMVQLLETLHSAPRNAWQLKTDILKTIMLCLRESHRTRTVFRKVNGFVNVTSVLVSLENKLASRSHHPDDLESSDTRQLLYSVFCTLSAAMRFEPANARFFQQEICATTTLCDTLRLLGCFAPTRVASLVDCGATGGVVGDGRQVHAEVPDVEELEVYHRMFVDGVLNINIPDGIPATLAYATVVFRLLYDVALDLFDKPNIINALTKSPHLSRQPSSEPQVHNINSMSAKRSAVNTLNLNPPTPDPIIVHPGVVVAMLQLLPCIQDTNSTTQPSTLSPTLTLQYYLADTIKSLVRSERNQQTMCDAGLVAQLLRVGAAPLQNEHHPLHTALQYMLERLAAQALEPADLRRFLRLGEPLNCVPLTEESDWGGGGGGGGPVALTRIKTIVSMTTPKDFRAQSSSTLPPFVEFDMSAEGFGCLYLPSIAPQPMNTGNVVTGVDTSVIGGIGTGDRMFPPQTGLSFSTWICVDKFSDPRTDPHCVRLLTLVRSMNNTREDHLVCLSLVLSARDKAIIVSTQETHIPHHISEWEPDGEGEYGARVWCPDILREGQWHHLVLVLNRAVLKNSSFSLYLDGVDIHTQKLHYVSQNPGGVGGSAGGGGGGMVGGVGMVGGMGVGGGHMTGSVYGFIGTPPAWRRPSRLCWKQGPCHLLEEVLSPTTVNHMYQLGPHYMGSFQAAIVNSPSSEPLQLVADEKVVFGLNAKAVSHLTLSKIRKVYSRVDNKSIAKQLGMSSHENATPIRILHNSAGHLAGSSRTLGGVVIGYLGVRVFSPRPVATVVDTVGGCSVLLGLIARAHTNETLYAAVKALVCVVRTNRAAQAEMDRRRGYQTLAMLLKQRKLILNSHILHLAFSLVGTVDSRRESSSIPNLTAFQDLLCDLDIWHEAPADLLRSHLEHLYELAAESSEKRTNAWIMRDLQLVAKLLHITSEVRHAATRHVLFALLETLLGGGGGGVASVRAGGGGGSNGGSGVTGGGQVKQSDLLWFGQFVAATLPSGAISEKGVELGGGSGSEERDEVGEGIVLRNRCLSLLFSLLFTNRNTVNLMVCDEISKTLGFDWVLLFMQQHLHATTTILGLRMLVVMCSTPTLMNRFRDGTHNGGWLRHELLSPNNKMSQTLGQLQPNSSPVANSTADNTSSNLGNSTTSTGNSGNGGVAGTEPVHMAGFQQLGWLLPGHLDTPGIYLLLTALMMGQPVAKSVPVTVVSVVTESNGNNNGPTSVFQFDLDVVWAFLWGGSVNSQPVGAVAPKVNLCAEAVVVLLGMARTALHCDQSVLPEWLRNHPISIVQVLFQLYHNMPEFMPIFMSAEVLNSLASLLFPPPPSTVTSITKADSLDSTNSGASTPADELPDTSLLSHPQSQSPPSSVIMQPPSQILSHTDRGGQLTTHPARQFVIDFIRVIVVDSLSLAVTAKTTAPVVDLVLDAAPPTASTEQQVCYQTAVLVTLMDHLLAADMLVGDQAAIPIVPLATAHVQNVAPNVFYLTARLVDKLWQGALTRDPHEVFDFIVKLIGQAKRRSGNLSLECLYHCLNRCILYLLSRPTESIADQMSVLEALHKLTTNRLIVFGAGNHEPEFVGCLTYCLLQLTADCAIRMDTHARTTWHVNPGATDVEPHDDRLNNHQARNLMAGAALRVWEELYVCKKPAIEEVCRVTLSAPVGGQQGGGKAPDLNTTRDQVSESAQKLWLNYIEAERKTTYRVPWELHNQIQSKIHKVTGGLTRLASRTKVRKDDVNRVRVRVTKQQSQKWVLNNINLVKELTEMRRQQRVNTAQHTQRYVHQEWLLTENELTRERGLWGSPQPCHLDKWMLDSTEGPHRMRKKLMRNDGFYRHYPYRPDYEKGMIKYKYATSYHSKEYYMAVQKRQTPCVALNGSSTAPPEPERTDSVCEDSTPSPLPLVVAPVLPHLARLKSDPEDQLDDVEAEEEPQPPPDNKTLLRLLQENEKISYMFRCARIQGLDTTEGLLLFGLEHCYVVDGFTLLKNRDIRDIEQALPSVGYEPILPNPGSPRKTRAMRQCSKFSYEDIREVHKRRYLLQPIALEVFSGDGRNHLLAFPRKVRNKVYQRFMATATGIADSAQQSVAGQKRTANVEQAAGLLSNLIGETSVTQRWVRGEISNFQYLMHLNTLAGRSYNDLMQYPVFPWIIADYESEELDLSDPATFRDFTRPMGAQSPDRLEQFKKRYKEWDDPHGETPPYHYGIHYSSAMIVCSYLVRMEPFTQHFLRLQGGHFDLADRMFHSVGEAWNSASRHNMADVKELIPEFFYLPDFLLNSNDFDLGIKQSGVGLGNVVLPPWAKQDPREYIRVHRMALECDYVSQHLHHWIDLIFGYKQQGQSAVDAVNVFHHLFYEGNVDIYNIDDPLKKNATIGFINNFGQIPKQLFKKPHPGKKMANGNNRTSVIDTGALVQAFSLPQPERLFFHHLDNLRPSLQPIKEVKSPVGQILHVDKAILAVEQNKVLIPPAYNRYVAWGFADHSLRIGHYDTDRAVFVSENCVQNSGEIVACVCPSAKLIVTAGTSTVVTIWEYECRRKRLVVKHSLYAHTEAVTCLAASPAYNVIVSGSRDCSAVIWDLSRGVFVRQLRGHAGPIAAVAVNDLTGDIATCAATWLHLWSINGDELAKVNTCVGRADRMQQILCVSFSQTHEWDASNVIMTGSTDGVTRMWSIDYVQVPTEDHPSKSSDNATPTHTITRPTPLHSRLVKQIHVSSSTESHSTSTNTNTGSLIKSGSESSLSEDNNSVATRDVVTISVVDTTTVGGGKEGNSKEWRSEQVDEKETCSDTEEGGGGKKVEVVVVEVPPVAAVRRRRSRVHTALRKSEGGNSAESNSLEVDDGSSMRTSKSDTSLTDSFVMVPESRKKAHNPLTTLRTGFKWQRQLVFRSKLTMHTAYDRKDNAEPASITALAVSKDHRTVFVGDARGRVFTFGVSEAAGRPADHWLKDEGADHCADCAVRFTLYERRHHCRNCGLVFCGKCSRFESEISRLRILKPVRVCQKCYAALKAA